MKAFAFLASLVVLATNAIAADPPKTPDEIIAFSVKQMGQYKSWSGSFGHLISDQGTPFPSEGTFVCQQPRQVRVDAKAELLGTSIKMLLAAGPDHIVWLEVIGNGGTNLMHGDLQKQPFHDIKSSVPHAIFLELMDPQQMWDNTRQIYNLQSGTNELLAGQSMLVLHGSLKPERARELLTADLTQDVVRVTGICRFLIGEQDGFIHLLERSIKYSLYNHKMSPLSESEGVVFKDLIFNGDVPAEKFVYRPPKGLEIIELPLKDAPEEADPPPPAPPKTK